MRHKTFITFLLLLWCLDICFSENATLTVNQCNITQFGYNYDTQSIKFLWNTTGENCERKNFDLVLKTSPQNHCKNANTNFVRSIAMSKKDFSHSIHLDRCGLYEYFIRQNNVPSFKTTIIFNISTNFTVTQKNDSSAEVSWKHSDYCCPKIYNLLVVRKFDNGIIVNETVEGTSYTITNLSSCWNYGISLELANLNGDGKINQFAQSFKLKEVSTKDFSLSPVQGGFDIRIPSKNDQHSSFLIKWKSENLLDINEMKAVNADPFIETKYSCMNYAVEIYATKEKDINKIFVGCVKSEIKGFPLIFAQIQNTHNYSL